MTRNDSNTKRHVSYDKHLDDYPTPPWATRAFFKFVVPSLLGQPCRDYRYIEPAAGRGHMERTIAELGLNSVGFDIKDYGSGYPVADYTAAGTKYPEYDIMLTNPPFKLAQQFVARGLREAKVGVGILARTLWAESTIRYNDIFKIRPPRIIAIFVGRVPGETGKLRRSGAIISHSWFWWGPPLNALDTRWTRFVWIPPEAQQILERDEDYA